MSTSTAAKLPEPSIRATVPARAVAELLQFVLEAPDPQTVRQRAMAGLGLLFEVAWAKFDVEQTPTGACGIELDDPDSGVHFLTVALRDPDDVDARQTIDGLLHMIRTVHVRAVESAQLRAAAHTDALTGLWNRRGFEPFVDQALARSTRTGEDVTLMLCDVDYFKRINDTHGHGVGDRALAAVAEAIASVIRPTDAAARIGGDEMSVLLASCNAQGARAVARRIQDALVRVQRERGLPESVTLSIGIADTRAMSAEALTQRAVGHLMAAADEALYQAKAEGRDRAECHQGCFTPVPLEDDPTAPIQLRPVSTTSARSPTAA
ncbi:MAG: diguanylate cyclase [Nannocystaceae bacterium]|nr:GGDEF domain-containing protein [bacterium]